MANIRKDLKGVVFVGGAAGELLKLRAGDPVPKGVKVGGHLLEPKETKQEPAEESTEIEFPGEDATRAELDAYAETIGIDHAGYKNKADLLEALK